MRVIARIATASTAAALLIGSLLVPVASAATTTLSAEADSWVLSSSPRANKGTVNPLRVRAGVRITYLRFRVPAFDASTTITSATLRLYSTSASRCTMQVLRAGNDTWGETSINWNNQPGVVGSVLASASWTGQAYRSFVVTPAVTKDAAVSFAVRHVPGCTTSSDATFSSRESATNRPQLVVETTVTAPPAVCNDGLDNDGDTKVDLADPGCVDATDGDETDPPPPPPPAAACEDGIDNDLDGKVDLGVDPGCAGVMDDDETDPPPPACNDGRDNDGDGLVDLADAGCTGSTDPVEVNVASSNGAPGAIFTCQATGQIGNIDPIVSPGVPSGHPHVFYGARDLTTIETTASLRTKSTSCVESDNRSGLWLPEVREDGVLLTPGQTAIGGGKHMLIYYRCTFNAATCANIVGFADGTRFVMGNARASSPAENPELGTDVIFKCGPGSGADLPYPPSQCDSGVLVISFRSDPCIALGATHSWDHRSHLVDPVRGVCPSGYEPTMRVEQFFRFWVGTDPIGMITLGGYPWWTAHSDYLFGWNRPAFENFTMTCVNANRDCGTNPSV